MFLIRRLISRLMISVLRIKSKIYKCYASAQVRKSFDLPGTIGKQTIKALLPAKPLIVEVGAHVGIDTLEFAVMYP